MKIDLILQRRNTWMGIAILWIVFFHSGIRCSFLPLSILKMLGYGGVDIFLFASGIGCLYSLKKDDNYSRFIKRRAYKLLPIYYTFLPAWFFVSHMMNVSFSINDIIGNILCIQWFTGKSKDVNWYISGICLLYFVAPFIFNLLNTSKNKLKYTNLVILAIIATIPFWDVHTYIVFVARIPIYILGMVAGQITYQKCIDNKSCVAAITLSFLGLFLLLVCYVNLNPFLWDKGLWWYPFLLITPGLCLAISIIGNCIMKTRFGKRLIIFIDILGQHSFEILLSQILVFNILFYKIEIGEIKNSNLIWLLSVIPIAVISYILNMASKRIVSCLTKPTQ